MRSWSSGRQGNGVYGRPPTLGRPAGHQDARETGHEQELTSQNSGGPMAKAKAKSAEQDPDRTRIVQRQTVDASAGGIGVKLSGTGRNVRRPTRKARLRIARFDPWSVMKTSFLFSIAAGIILFIAVWVVWGIISLSGALDQAQEALTALVGSSSGSGLELSNYVSQWRVLGFTAIVAVLNVVFITAVCTLLSFLYNLAANVIGGLEVTLAED
ncbi:transmembrane PF12089 domain protein [Propionibacterium acidifaciens F0233]|uniref:Transmembrane PF12089 domain protein n=2 Tax=Propionibacterium acidifaciens TaxID=556499 RepID=U2QTG0_9ACTN|nr:transmembrane PF12089 domain protein [Propionibacterium acidifaciens F0233]